ncbi:MAG TPA: hypothetical protein DCY74_05805, partial [Clostridiales bacterium]|nr:hypothetical protein [Clostridiales bacterium]
MNIFKRLLALFLICTFSLIMFACNENYDKDDSNKNDPSDNNDDEQYTGLDEEPPVLELLTIKNQTSSGAIPTHCYYPYVPTLLDRLVTIRNAIESGSVDESTVKTELSYLLRMGEDLSLYYDYAQNLCTTDGTMIYGASSEVGSRYETPPATLVANDDDSLKKALEVSYPGDVILIRDQIEINMSDLYSAGDYDQFHGEKIDYCLNIPAGVTIAGERGKDGKTGGVLKVSDETDLLITLGEGSRLSGLVIQGPDGENNRNCENISFGILMAGNNSIVDNCEIAGFADTAVKVAANGVQIKNNYFHHIQSEFAGYAIAIANGQATVEGNLFNHISHLIYIQGASSSLTLKNNVEAGSLDGEPILIDLGGGKDIDFPAQVISAKDIIVENNTFLSPNPLFELNGLPSTDWKVRYNLFAYDPYFHNSGELKLQDVTQSIYDRRYICENNVYDVRNPRVISKKSGVSTSGYVLSGKKVTAFTVFETKAPPVFAQTYTTPITTGAYYTLDGSPYRTLRKLLNSDKLTPKQSVDYLDNVFQAFTGYDYQNIQVLLTKNAENDPTGGGKGYSKIYSTGDYVVTDLYDLQYALIKAKAGEVVFIPGGTVMDFSIGSELNTLVVPEGVTIASDRGLVREDGSVSPGAIITSFAMINEPLIDVSGNNVTLSGIVLKGCDPFTHYSHYNKAYETGLRNGNRYYAMLPYTRGIVVTGSNLTIDNCEFTGFSFAAIHFDTGSDRIVSENNVISHCYFHHNQRASAGIAVSVVRGK